MPALRCEGRKAPRLIDLFRQRLECAGEALSGAATRCEIHAPVWRPQRLLLGHAPELSGNKKCQLALVPRSKFAILAIAAAAYCFL